MSLMVQSNDLQKIGLGFSKYLEFNDIINMQSKFIRMWKLDLTEIVIFIKFGSRMIK